MKIAILGAAGVRTPLILQALAARQPALGLDELALMDLDARRLDLMVAVAAALAGSPGWPFRLVCTSDSRRALDGADFVITTFRVGGMAARVIDERVPLRHGVLGQETTGPGGFAMALRTIPVLLEYLQQMAGACPQAWLINFANPAGMLAEAAQRAGWRRTVGICDAPYQMAGVAAALAGIPADELFVDYFGLNHLGWVRGAVYQGDDLLPRFLAMLAEGGLPGLPFDAELIASMGLIPNEYLYYYYHTAAAVRQMQAAPVTRGERLLALNEALLADLARLQAAGDLAGLADTYRAYIAGRSASYMADAEGGAHGVARDDAGGRASIAALAASATGGYAGVALDLIEALAGGRPRQMIVNVPNRGAISGMDSTDVVEVPVYAGCDLVRPLAVGKVPSHCLGLMQQVKAYERLTIRAATEGSYAAALQALALHPLVHDAERARAILNEYCAAHGALFPELR